MLNITQMVLYLDFNFNIKELSNNDSLQENLNFVDLIYMQII